MTIDMRQALDERRELIERRADAVLTSALADQEPWTVRLGQPPRDKKQHALWRRAARTIAAYRDRYQITDDRDPLGHAPESTNQKIDAARARATLRALGVGPSWEDERRATPTPTRGLQV